MIPTPHHWRTGEGAPVMRVASGNLVCNHCREYIADNTRCVVWGRRGAEQEGRGGMTPKEMEDRIAELESDVRELQIWARRYADRRMTTVVDAVNHITSRMIERGNQPFVDPTNNDTVWATDGVFGPPADFVEKYGMDGRLATPAANPTAPTDTPSQP